MSGEAPRAGEFELIRRYFAPLAATHPAGLGLEDDAAVFSLPPGREIVVTTDTMVEGVHYPVGEAADFVARKLLRVNLSDLAAMGARPEVYFLNTAWPPGLDEDWIAAFAAGLAADQQEFGIALAGGDTVATSGPAVFTLSALGSVEAGRALRRGGAAVGDLVYVSGTIGDGTLGLEVALSRKLEGPSLRQLEELHRRYRLPDPRLALGAALASSGGGTDVHAAADVSDGLVADLGHICAASRAGALIRAEAVPLSDAARAALARNPSLLARLVTGGDDYELVFTLAPPAAERIEALAERLGTPVTRIGEIVPGAAVSVVDGAGQELPLAVAGYRHS